MTLDVSTDASIFDGTQTVTLRQLRGDGADDVTVTYVTKSPLNQRQIMAIGSMIDLDGSERMFSLPVVTVGSGEIKRGDLITDEDGELWEVLSCDLKTLDTRWSCLCRRQV